MSNNEEEEEVEVQKPSPLFPDTVRSLCELSALAIAKDTEKYAGSTFLLYEAPLELRVHIASAVREQLTEHTLSSLPESENKAKILSSWLTKLQLTYDYSIDLSSKNTKRSILNTLQTFNQFQVIKFVEDDDDDDDDVNEISLRVSTQSLGSDFEKQQDDLIRYYENLDNPNDNANELRRSKGLARSVDDSQILCKVLSQCPNIFSAVFYNCAGVTDEAIKLLSKLKHLGYLDLSECWNFDENNLQMLSTPPLKYLSLAGCDITDKFLRTFRSQTITQLDLSRCSRITDYGKLTEIPNLQKLSLADCKPLTNKTIEYLVLCKNLVSLDLSGCIGVSDKGIVSFGKLASTALPNLRELGLNFCRHLNTPSVCLMLRELQQLTSIQLQDYDIRDMKKLKSSNFKFAQILSLDLSGSSAATSYDFRRFVGQFPSLQSLSLQNIRDSSLSEFKNLDTLGFNLTQLVYLDVLGFYLPNTQLPTNQAPKFPMLSELTALDFSWVPSTSHIKKIYIADDEDMFWNFQNYSVQNLKSKKWNLDELVISDTKLPSLESGWLRELLEAFPLIKKLTFHDCNWPGSSPTEIFKYLDGIYELAAGLCCIQISVPNWEEMEAELKARLAKVTKIQIMVEPISRKEVERLAKNKITQIQLHKHGIF